MQGNCSVQSLSHVQLFETLWTTARQTSLSITNPRSLLKFISIESVGYIQTEGEQMLPQNASLQHENYLNLIFFLEDEWLFLKLESRWLFCESHLQEKSHFKEVSLYTSRRKTVLWNSSSIRKADINLHNNHTLPFLFLYFKYLFVYVAVPGWPSLKQARYLAVACEFLVVACKI